MVSIPQASNNRARTSASSSTKKETEKETHGSDNNMRERSARRVHEHLSNRKSGIKRVKSTNKDPKQIRSKASDTARARVARRTAITEEVIERLGLKDLSTEELHAVMDFSINEIQERRIKDKDIDALLDKGFKECFNQKGIATSPMVEDGIVFIPGSVRETNKSGKHECKLFTVRIGGEDRWSWDFEDRIIGTKTFRNDDLRKTMTLYPAIDGMIVFGHDRKMVTQQNSSYPVHKYKSGGASALQLHMDEKTGKARFIVAPAIETRALPVPTGIESE